MTILQDEVCSRVQLSGYNFALKPLWYSVITDIVDVDFQANGSFLNEK